GWAAAGRRRGDAGRAGGGGGDQRPAGPAAGPVHRVGDGVLVVEDGPGDDQPEAGQRAAGLQAGEPARAGQGEGADGGHRQPGDQVDGGGVAAGVLQGGAPRGEGRPQP